MKKMTGLILAAGFSSRMGAFKPLLPFQGEPLIIRQINTMKDAGLEKIVVVTGYESEDIKNLLGNSVHLVHNEDFQKGMYSSLLSGLNYIMTHLYEETEGILYLPVDYPLVTKDEYLKLHEAWKKDKNSFAVPVFMGKKGHPLLIPRAAVPLIISNTGKAGLKEITRFYENKDMMIRVPVNNEGVLLDMDEQEDYQLLLKYVAVPFESTFDKFSNTLYLVRHGETVQHREKVFIGQYDVDLNDKGRKQGERIEEALGQQSLENPLYISSDLKRAVNTMKIIAGVDDFVTDRGFREIDLGSWDGEAISYIKTRYPNDYQDRGNNTLTWKGHGGENFYDLRYRVLKSLVKYFDEDKDIVLISHKGVMEAIITFFMGMNLEEKNKLNLPKGSLAILSFSKGQ